MVMSEITLILLVVIMDTTLIHSVVDMTVIIVHLVVVMAVPQVIHIEAQKAPHPLNETDNEEKAGEILHAIHN